MKSDEIRKQDGKFRDSCGVSIIRFPTLGRNRSLAQRDAPCPAGLAYALSKGDSSDSPIIRTSDIDFFGQRSRRVPCYTIERTIPTNLPSNYGTR